MSFTATLTWVFIVLFSGILFLYFRNVFITVRFWKKERPKKPDHHWKNRFPLIDHLVLTTQKKKLVQTGIVIIMLLLLVYWSQQDGETQLYALMVVTFFFACLMITREFPQHIFLINKKLIAWSVHESSFPLVTDPPYVMIYRATITKKDVISTEQTKFGYIFTLKEGKKLYIRANHEQKEAIGKWLKK
ncbi:hypothetical protein CN918_25630 [Priestia megaterium]|nr:hypothetical protein CN918_25630 [Priestia megaterium]